ncbi:MAG: hypothetical protein ACKVZJ_11490 [Phycisphaerales bacterium]
MSSVDHGKALTALLKRLKPRYEPAPPLKHEPMDELLLGVLMWEATRSKAEAALKRLRDAHVDDNDMRVTRPAQLAAIIGKTYPKVDERSARLHAVLSDIYTREHTVSLERAMGMSKREAAKYIETLSGLPAYASARWQLIVLESHHVPVDDRMLARLIATGVLEEGDDIAKATGVLERYIRHEDVLASYLLLQAWCEDPDAEPEKPAAKKTPGRSAADTGKARSPVKTPAKKAAARSGK